jgi:TonB-linked SusC/RagA family outer membrane protein
MKRSLIIFSILMLFGGFVFAQSRTITGVVKDDAGNPVSGASVIIKGTKAGVSANAAGEFTITANTGDILEISAASFSAKEVTVGASNSLDITLARGNNVMEAVVVTALGQTTRKAKIGYSTTTFNSQQINQAAPVSAVNSLSGKVAGAEISNVGGPGSSTKVVLRGYGVISGGNNQPLYVIDGVPLTDARFGSTVNNDFGNSANDINPNDIESVSILHGTAAASLYGSAARNGAIMITTKRGKSGKLHVDFAGSVNFSLPGKLPTMQDEFGQGWGGVFVLGENGSWGPKLDNKVRAWGSIVDNSQLIKPFSFVKNNIRDFYNTGIEYNNTLALSGGNATTTFYFSYGNVESDGILPTNTDYLGRNTLALRTNSKFGGFSINTSFNYVNKKVNAPFTGQGGSDGSSLFEDILQIPVDLPIKDFRDYKNKFFDVNSYFTPYAENPYYVLNENLNTQTSDRFFGNIDMNYKFTSSLAAQLRVGADVENARTFGYKAINAPAPGSWNAGGNTEGASRAADVGSVSERSDYAGSINGDFILKYNRDISNDFSLDALAGVNYFQADTKAVTAGITNLLIPGFYNLSNSTIKPTTADARSQRRLIGVYAQATLGFKNQLYLTLNARNDWSSTLPINHNHFFYPGGSASWVASQTFNLTNTPISYLKFRAAYGKTGFDAQPYQLYPVLVVGNVGLPFGSITFPFNGVSSFLIQNSIANAALKPVLTTEGEVGVEMRFINDRLGLDVALYDKRTNGQIFNVPIAPSSGYTSLVQNLGLVSNKGIEVTFNAKILDSKNLTWNVSYNFSKNWNKVENLTGGPKNVILNTAYDAELDAYPGKSVFGLYAPVPAYTADGKIIVNASSGVPIVDTAKGYYGDAENDYRMGFTNTFTFKGISLNFTLDYRQGGVMYSGTSDLLNFVGNAIPTTYNDRRPFIIPNSVVQKGTDTDGKPIYAENTKAITESTYDSYWYPTSNLALTYQQRIIDRSFLKLREVSLSYRLPEKWASKISSTNLSLTIYGRNLLLWTPESNPYIDPEASNLGNDLTSQLGEFRTAPTSKTFGVALKASF